jgi:hypothetical protein
MSARSGYRWRRRDDGDQWPGTGPLAGEADRLSTQRVLDPSAGRTTARREQLDRDRRVPPDQRPTGCLLRRGLRSGLRRRAGRRGRPRTPRRSGHGLLLGPRESSWRPRSPARIAYPDSCTPSLAARIPRPVRFGVSVASPAVSRESLVPPGGYGPSPSEPRFNLISSDIITFNKSGGRRSGCCAGLVLIGAEIGGLE